MVLWISTGDGVVGYGAVDPYWGRCGRVCRCRDVVLGNGAIDLYWGRNGREWCCRSLLGTMLKRMTLYMSTGDIVTTSPLNH